jgi:flagellar basal-body rod modification protein FlgD
MTNVATAMSNLSSIVNNIDSSLLVGQLSGMIGKEVQWTTTATVTDSSGNAVLDSKGNTQTTTTKHTGTVAGVSISDGSPSLIVTASESGSTNTYKVAISDLTRVGSTGTTTA